MKPIYFFDGEHTERFLGFGQMTTLFQTCYFKAMELGYDKVIIEWHHKISYLWDDDGNFKENVNIPGNGIVPITFVQKGTRVAKSIDRIDLSKPNVLYDGCVPVISRKFNMNTLHNYLNLYYDRTGKRPIFHIKKDKVEPYVLFHYRYSEQERQLPRNTPIKKWKWIKDYIKNTYGNKYKLIKIGEPSPIDNEFDKVIGYFNNNIEELFRLMNNSSLYICSAAGPVSLAYMFEIPSIVFYDEMNYNIIYENGWNSRDDTYGNTVYDWIDRDKLFGNTIPDEYLDKNKLEKYIKGKL